MYQDWFVVKLFASIFGSFVAPAAIPLFWGVWTPIAGAGGAFVMAMVISVTLTLLDP